MACLGRELSWAGMEPQCWTSPVQECSEGPHRGLRGSQRDIRVRSGREGVQVREKDPNIVLQGEGRKEMAGHLPRVATCSGL